MPARKPDVIHPICSLKMKATLCLCNKPVFAVTLMVSDKNALFAAR